MNTTTDSVELAWPKHAGAARYQVFLAGNPTPLVETADTHFVDAAPTPDATYDYLVKALDAGGRVMVQSNTVRIKFPSANFGAPAAVEQLLATLDADTHSAKLSWRMPKEQFLPVISYQIYRSDAPGQLLGSTRGTHFEDLTLQPGVTYTYTVVAVDILRRKGTPKESNSIALPRNNVDTTAPSVPAGLKGLITPAGNVELSWTASTDDVAVLRYEIERSDLQGQLAVSSTAKHTDDDVQPGKQYGYRVRAVDTSNNASDWSPILQVQTPQGSDTTAPTVPASVTSKALSPTSIQVSWAASTDNIGVTKYQIARADKSGVLAESSTLNYTDNAVVGDTTYAYQVRSVDAAGNASGWSATTKAKTPAAPDTTAPSVPTKLSATAASATRVDLSWQAATDNVGVVKYQILRDGHTGVLAESTATTYADTTVVGDTTYVYRVRAVDAANNQSAASGNAQVRTPAAPDTQPPTVPGSLTAKALGTTEIELTWAPSSDNVGVAKYQIIRVGHTGVLKETSSTRFTDTGLTADTSYSYQVRAVDAANNPSALSASAQARTNEPKDTDPPSAPGNLKASAASATLVNLTWTQSTDNKGVAKYQVLRNGQAIGEATTPAYADKSVSAKTNYSYTVQAVDAAGNVSAASSAAQVTTPDLPDTEAPSVPTGLKATPASATRVDLTWGASKDNVGVTKYQVLRDGQVIGEPTGTTFADTKAAPASTYTYSVKALDAAGNASAASPGVKATTQTAPDTQPPTVPSNLEATPASATRVDLTWTPSYDNIGVAKYEVLRDSKPIAESTTASYADTSAVASTSYSYSVRALDAAGNASAASDPVKVKTPGGGSTTPTTTAKSCSQADVQKALNDAPDGSIVAIPEGTCDWGSAPAATRKAGVWLKGAGKNKTVIKRNAPVIPKGCTLDLYYDSNGDLQINECNGAMPPEEYLVKFDCSNGKRVEVSDLSLIGNDADQTEAQRILDVDQGLGLINGCQDFKVHDASFSRFSNAGLTIRGQSRGVVYQSDFFSNFKCQDKDTKIPNPSGGYWKITEPLSCLGYGVVVYGDSTWTSQVQWGTQDAVFIEDSAFRDNRHHVASNLDSHYVVRYSNIAHTERARNYGALDAHGKGSYGPGSRAWEIYNNTFVDATTTQWNTTGIVIRGGDGVAFNNTVPSTFGYVLGLTTESDCNASTYPIEHQTRTAYIWGNHAPNKSDLESPTKAVQSYNTGCLKEGRDFNLTQKPGYAPYAYPHPLRSKPF